MIIITLLGLLDLLRRDVRRGVLVVALRDLNGLLIVQVASRVVGLRLLIRGLIGIGLRFVVISTIVVLVIVEPHLG